MKIRGGTGNVLCCTKWLISQEKIQIITSWAYRSFEHVILLDYCISGVLFALRHYPTEPGCIPIGSEYSVIQLVFYFEPFSLSPTCVCFKSSLNCKTCSFPIISSCFGCSPPNTVSQVGNVFLLYLTRHLELIKCAHNSLFSVSSLIQPLSSIQCQALHIV